MADTIPEVTIPTTEIPINGTVTPDSVQEMLSGDPMIDKFAALDEGGPAKGIHDEIQSLGEEGGEDNGLQEQEGEETGQEVTGTQEGGSPKDVKSDSSSPTLKVFTAKHGERAIEIPEDTVFTVKIEGKEVQATAADLLRNYQGKVPWERHYRELKENTRKFNQDVAAVDQKLKEITELAQADPFKALERMCVLAGKNPGDWLESYLEQAKATAEDVSKRSPEEIKSWISSKKNEYEAERVKKERAAVDSEKTKIDVQKFIERKQVELGVSEEELLAGWEVANDPKNAALHAQMTPMQIAESVFDFITLVERPYQMIKATVQEISPELARNGGFINELRGHFKDYPELTPDDIKIVVNGYLGSRNGKSQAKPSEDSTKERPKAKATNFGGPTSPKIPQKKTEKRVEALEDFDPITADDLDKLTQFFK